jgi:deazaflavin-dependent oxidoreductase (nitroreductase family)
MAEYIPSPRDWVREQVELYERSDGTEGTTLRDTGLPVIIVTHTGNRTGAIRKTPLMRVKDGANYVLVGSQGGAPTHPVWVHDLRVNPAVEIRDHTVVQARCGCARSKTKPSGHGSGLLPSRRIRRTRNTRRGPLGRSWSSSQSRSASGTRR